jgi:central glycolytic genes regulator
MDRFVSLQRKIAPEIARLLDIRYSILRHVHFYQPIGRRTLSQQLTVKERAVRSELEFLRRQGFVSVSSSGVTLTQDGEVIFQELGQYVRELREFARLEQLLERLLPIRKIVVVAGDSRRDPAVKKDMGRAVVRILREIVEDGDIIAAGGGTTMVEVAKAIVPSGWPKHIAVVPTRGSLGEEVEIQADSITTVKASPLAGAVMITFFAPAVRWLLALSAAVNTPVDSTTMSTPISRHGIA